MSQKIKKEQEANNEQRTTNNEQPKSGKDLSGWNELEFLSWEEFLQMAPSILQLEISRLSKLLDTPLNDPDIHNALVKGRYQLKCCAEKIEGVEKATVESVLSPFLTEAAFQISAALNSGESSMDATLHYVLDRIAYIHNRIQMIY